MTTRNLRLLTLAFALALPPSAASAQRTRSAATDPVRKGPSGPSMRAPTTREVEELNPAWLMGDKRKKLALTDSQVAQFKALELKLRERDRQMMAEYDSVRRDFHPPAGSLVKTSPSGGDAQTGATDRDVEKARTQLRVLTYIIGQIAERRTQDVEQVLALLADEAQKKKALEFLNEQGDDLTRMLPRGGPPPAGAF